MGTFDTPDKEVVFAAIRKNSTEDGWALLAKVGATLKAEGINYGKLTLFFNKFSEYVDVKSDDSVFPPIAYAKIKTKSSPSELLQVENTIQSRSEKSTHQKVTEKLTFASETTHSVPKNALKEWAWLSKSDKPKTEMGQSEFRKWVGEEYQKTIRDLKKLALKERWYYNDKNPLNPYPILVNYLIYTFYRLQQEKDKILYSDKYAAFNTGLVDGRYEQIYALFSKTNYFKQPWRLVDFCIAGEDFAGKTLVKNFASLPERAHYFNNISDMLYDSFSSAPKMNLKHIILENISRLPLPFLEEYAPRTIEFKDVSRFNFLEREAFFDSLAEAIKSDSKCERHYTYRLNQALDLSLKRVQWNFKTAIPMYFPTHNTMSLLLPLCLVDDESVDIALVVEKTKSGNYLGHTVLPLEWAYSNARLVSRPDSDWLIADKIVPTSSIDRFDFEE